MSIRIEFIDFDIGSMTFELRYAYITYSYTTREIKYVGHIPLDQQTSYVEQIIFLK